MKTSPPLVIVPVSTDLDNLVFYNACVIVLTLGIGNMALSKKERHKEIEHCRFLNPRTFSKQGPAGEFSNSKAAAQCKILCKAKAATIQRKKMLTRPKHDGISLPKRK